MKSFLTKAALACVLMPCQGVVAVDVEIIAHRGASHDAPENTLESVKLGWEQGADAVEIDVYLSKDGHIVVHHDGTTKKLAGVDRKVVDQTLAELQQLDVGAWKGDKWKGVRIPKLADVLATIPEGRRLFVEVKCGPEIVPDLAKAFKRSGKKPKQLVVISFDYEVVKQAKARLPKIECFYLSSFKVDEETGEQTPSAGEVDRLGQGGQARGHQCQLTRGLETGRSSTRSRRRAGVVHVDGELAGRGQALGQARHQRHHHRPAGLAAA